MAVSPDGRHAASGSFDKTVAVWDGDRRRLPSSPGTGLRVMSVAVSPDGRHVVSGAEDGTVAVWDADRRTAARAHRT